jgi:hypothetical protein
MAYALNCTPRITDVRRLRAAAFAPYIVGLTILLVAVPLSLAYETKIEAAQFLAVSVALFVVALSVKRGFLIATITLAGGLVAIVIFGFMNVVHETRVVDAFTDLGTCVVAGIPCWLALRGVTASWRLRRVTWHRERAGGIGHSIAELPRDARLIRAVSPLAGALVVYGTGFCAALLVGLATGIGWLAGLALLAFALVGSRAMQRARRTLASRVAEVRARDPRAPLLLVRSFYDDNLEIEPRFEYFGRLLRKRLTLEEFVVGYLLTMGPVVAIGKPREDLSPLGAAREYLSGPNWQQRVATILDECSWVVAILGSGEGLIWEYEQVVWRQMTNRFILVIPPVTVQVIRQRWEAFQKAFPPATAVDWSLTAAAGVPLCAVFPERAAPLLFCSKYQNETAYSVVFAMLLQGLTCHPPYGSFEELFVRGGKLHY